MSNPVVSRRTLAVVVATFCFVPLSRADTLSTSTSYRLQTVTLNTGGSPAVSATNAANGSLGQELTVGASASPHFILQSGFWSDLGSTVVPVVLHANRDASLPGAVALTWSGNNTSYDVYRSTACASVFDTVLALTTNNAYTDATAPTTGLTCFNVQAVAPGPLPPSGQAAAP
jgi:hypothetical protein